MLLVCQRRLGLSCHPPTLIYCYYCCLPKNQLLIAYIFLPLAGSLAITTMIETTSKNQFDQSFYYYWNSIITTYVSLSDTMRINFKDHYLDSVNLYYFHYDCRLFDPQWFEHPNYVSNITTESVAIQSSTSLYSFLR